MTVRDFEFLHLSGVHISRHLKDAELVSVLPAVEASKADMLNGWVWYRLPSFTDGEVVVSISLGFNDGALQFVILTDAHTKYGAGWSEWSDEKERLRVSSIGGWLARMGYPVGTYSWGSISAGYDAKGGAGSASVRYAPNPTTQAICR